MPYQQAQTLVYHPQTYNQPLSSPSSTSQFQYQQPASSFQSSVNRQQHSPSSYNTEPGSSYSPLPPPLPPAPLAASFNQAGVASGPPVPPPPPPLPASFESVNNYRANRLTSGTNSDHSNPHHASYNTNSSSNNNKSAVRASLLSLSNSFFIKNLKKLTFLFQFKRIYSHPP